jgi:hypothetical protein
MPARVSRRRPLVPFQGLSASGLVALLSLALASPANAQIRASERAVVTQTADGTVLSINYSRPRARGRADVFGKVVHPNEVWTPGANWATTLEVNRDVMLDGHAVPKGKYSVWFVIGARDWTVILDPRHERYHEERPDSIPAQVRWTVTPQESAFREVLTWSFPEVRPDGTQLLFEWADKRVAIDATVRPSHPLPIARADAEPFIGTYEWKWADSGTEVSGTVELYYEGGMLRQRHAPFPQWYPLLQDQPMVRILNTWFIAAIVRDGKVWEMVSDMVYEFDVVNGKATGFQLRDDRDHLLGSGKRVIR